MIKSPNQLHCSQKLISNSFRVNLSDSQTEFINYPLHLFLFCGSLEVFDLLSHALYIYSHCLGKVYLILRAPLTANCYLRFYLFQPKILLRYRKISNDQRDSLSWKMFLLTTMANDFVSESPFRRILLLKLQYHNNFKLIFLISVIYIFFFKSDIC